VEEEEEDYEEEDEESFMFEELFSLITLYFKDKKKIKYINILIK
jgi:hypothetical protein